MQIEAKVAAQENVSLMSSSLGMSIDAHVIEENEIVFLPKQTEKSEVGAYIMQEDGTLRVLPAFKTTRIVILNGTSSGNEYRMTSGAWGLVLEACFAKLTAAQPSQFGVLDGDMHQIADKWSTGGGFCGDGGSWQSGPLSERMSVDVTAGTVTVLRDGVYQITGATSYFTADNIPPVIHVLINGVSVANETDGSNCTPSIMMLLNAGDVISLGFQVNPNYQVSTSGVWSGTFPPTSADPAEAATFARCDLDIIGLGGIQPL